MCQIFVKIQKGNKVERQTITTQFMWDQLLRELPKSGKCRATISDSEDGRFQSVKHFLGYDLDQTIQRLHSETKFAHR